MFGDLKRHAVCMAVVIACAITGCATPPTISPHFSVGELPATLARPNVRDWTADRFAGKRLQQVRLDYLRHLSTFTSSTGWSATGVSAASMGGSSTDYIPNGPAEVYNGSAAPSSIQSKGFFLTKSGNLIRVAAGSDPTQSANRKVLALGETFTKTNITLSPSGSRAYCLSDDGTLFVVDTINMAIFSQTSLGGGLNCQGLSPVFDPATSNSDDSREDLYVPTSDGNVHRFMVSSAGPGTTPTLTAKGTYAIASGSGSVKLAASPIAYAGKLYVGDESGTLTIYDVTTSSVSSAYSLGSVGIAASPAIDTDSSGNPTAVFVTVGSSCAWIDLPTTTVHFSRPLFLDDSGMSLPASGFLLAYRPTNLNYYYLSLQDNTTMNVDSGYPNLNSFSAYKEQTDISPGDSYVSSNSPSGTASAAYLRFSNADGDIPSTATIQDVQLLMKPDASMRCPPPQVEAADPYLSGTSTLWTYGTMTSTTRPSVGAVIGNYVGSLVGGSSHANATYSSGSYSRWDISGYPSTPQSDYGLALVNNSGGNAAFAHSSVSASNSNSSGIHRSPAFQRGTVTGTNQYAGAQASTPAATGPLLEFLVSTSKRTYPSIQTPPIIDSARDAVYVCDTNAVYILDYSSSTNFEDTDVSLLNGTQTDHTLFCLTRMGQKSYGTGHGTTYTSNGSVYFVSDYSAPVLGYDGNELYVLSRYPTTVSSSTDLPTVYTYALTKMAISSFSAGGATASTFSIGNYQEFTGLTASEEACANMSMDLFSLNFSSAGDHINFALPGTSTSTAGTAFIDSP